MTIAFMNIGTQEMILILIMILLLFGGKKLPEMARGLGRGIREFKDASEGIKREMSEQINRATEPAAENVTRKEEAPADESEADLKTGTNVKNETEQQQ